MPTRLRNADGQTIEVDDDAVGYHAARGWTPESTSDATVAAMGQRADDDRGIGGALGAGVTSTLSGLTLGASDVALAALASDTTREKIQADREANPTLSMAGQLVGAVLPSVVAPGSALAGTPAGYLSRTSAGGFEAARATSGALGVAKSLAVTGTEGAFQNAGMYLADAALGDRQLTAEGMTGALGAGFAFGTLGGAAIYGIEGGTIAARRLFARAADGGEKAAQLAETAWQQASQEVREAGDAAVEVAKSKLAAAKAAREEAALASQRAAVDLAEARLPRVGPTPATDEAKLAELVSEYDNAKVAYDQALEDALTKIDAPEVGMPGGQIEKLPGKFGEPELAEGTPVSPENRELMDALDQRARQLEATAVGKRPGGVQPVAANLTTKFDIAESGLRFDPDTRSYFKEPTTGASMPVVSAPSSANANNSLESLLAGTKAKLDEGQTLGQIASESPLKKSYVTSKELEVGKPLTQTGDQGMGQVLPMMSKKKIEEGLSKLGAEHEPPAGWEDKVLGAVAKRDPIALPRVTSDDEMYKLSRDVEKNFSRAEQDVVREYADSVERELNREIAAGRASNFEPAIKRLDAAVARHVSDDDMILTRSLWNMPDKGVNAFDKYKAMRPGQVFSEPGFPSGSPFGGGPNSTSSVQLIMKVPQGTPMLPTERGMVLPRNMRFEVESAPTMQPNSWGEPQVVVNVRVVKGGPGSKHEFVPTDRHAEGVQGARWFADSNGDQWIGKDYGGDVDRVEGEHLANRIYKLFEIEVPETKIVSQDGRRIMMSKDVGGDTSTTAELSKSNAKEGMVVDAWLANWDGANWNPDGVHDNMLLRGSGADLAVRVDNGGTTIWRGHGAPKEFKAPVQELDTFLNPDYPAGQVYGSLSRGEVEQQLVDFAASYSKNREAIERLVDEAQISADAKRRIREGLRERGDWLVEQAKRTDRTPSLTPSEYEEFLSKSKAVTGDKTIVGVNKYAVSGYEEVNRDLRSQHPDIAPWNQKIIDALDRAIGRTTLPRRATLYRGIGYTESEPFRKLASLKPGETFVDNGFGSTAASRHVSRTYAERQYTINPATPASEVFGLEFEIVAPAGQHAFAVESQVGTNEYEILLPRKTSYRVLANEAKPNGQRTIRLEIASDKSTGASAGSDASRAWMETGVGKNPVQSSAPIPRPLAAGERLEMSRIGNTSDRKMLVKRGDESWTMSSEEAQAFFKASMPSGFRPDLLNIHGMNASIEHGVPKSADQIVGNALYVVRPSELAARGVLGSEIRPHNLDEIRSAFAEEKALPMVRVEMSPSGKLVVEDGNHRLQVAAETDRPIAVRFKAVANEPPKYVSDISDRLRHELDRRSSVVLNADTPVGSVQVTPGTSQPQSTADIVAFLNDGMPPGFKFDFDESLIEKWLHDRETKLGGPQKASGSVPDLVRAELPKSAADVSPHAVYVFDPRDLLSGPVLGEPVETVRIRAAKAAMDAGRKVRPIEAVMTTDGKVYVENGVNRLIAAAERGTPAAFRIRGVEGYVPSPYVGDISGQLKGAIRSDIVLGTTIGLGQEPKRGADDGSLESLLRGTKDQLDAGVALRDVAPGAAPPVPPRFDFDDIPKVAAASNRVEKAVAELTEHLGPEAPPTAVASAKAFRAAEAEAERKQMERTTRAIDDTAEAAPPTPKEQRAATKRADAERVAAAKAGKLEADAALARSRLAESEAMLGLRDAQGAATSARERAGNPGLAAATVGLPAPAPTTSPPKSGGMLGALANVGAAMEAANTVGVPGVPDPSSVPVVGPILGAYLKYRALKMTMGRFVGRIPATPETKAAALAATIKDRIAKAVDRSLGVVAEAAPKARSAATNSVLRAQETLKSRAFDDGEPDAPKNATLPALAAARIREVAYAATNPKAVIAQVRRELRNVVDPDLIAAAEKHRLAIYQHLNDTAPKAPPPNPYSRREPEPSPALAAKWARRLEAAFDPASVFEAMSDGSLTIEAVETLRVTNPRLFSLAQQRLVLRAGDLSRSMPYMHRLRGSMFFDMPLDPSFEAGSPSLLQSGPRSNSSAPAPGGVGRVSPGMTQLSTMFQTAADRRAAR